MFVKTKNAIWDLNGFHKVEYGVGFCYFADTKSPFAPYIYQTDIISQSENIEDLFDEVVFENKGYVIVGSRRSLKKSVFEEMETQDFKIYGAIWVDTDTQPTLKSVAKYENGEWVLL